MATVEIKISDELLKAAGVPEERRSEEVAKLLALELYRERAISLGRAAELGGVSIGDSWSLPVSAKSNWTLAWKTLSRIAALSKASIRDRRLERHTAYHPRESCLKPPICSFGCSVVFIPRAVTTDPTTGVKVIDPGRQDKAYGH